MSDLVFDSTSAINMAVRRLPSSIRQPLRPHITGGHAGLFRYAQASEKSLIALGAYTAGADADYSWPNLPAGAIVDQSYVKLYMDGVLLRYFQDAIGSGDTIAPVASKPNQVRSAATRWQTANGLSRAAALLDRDVAVGDKIYLTDGVNEHWTRVHGFVAETVAASVASSAPGDAANASGISASSSITQTAGTANDITEAVTHTYYKGLVDGDISEVYTITVTQAPTTPGDATTARLSVTSASGRDDVASVTPSPYGSITPIGTRGARATFSHTSDDFVVGQVWQLTIQQTFTAPTATGAGTFTGTSDLVYAVTVSRGGIANATSPLAAPSVQATVAPTGGGATGGTLPAGDYYAAYTFVSLEGETTIGSSTSAVFTVGATNIPRITVPALPTNCVGINIYLTDTDGATPGTLRLYRKLVVTTTSDATDDVYGYTTYANSTAPPSTNTATVTTPQITAVATVGTDSSGPTVVPNSSTAVAIGSFGATISFNQTNLRKGDIYYVTCTAAASGSVQTLILDDNLPSTMSGASDLELRLYITQDGYLVPQDREDSPPDTNWSLDADTFTVDGTITGYHASWTDGGVQQALSIVGGDLFVEYRAWLQTHVEKVSQITSINDLTASLGTNHPDNPLAYAVGKAVALTGGLAVKFTAVSDPSVQADWEVVPPILEELADTYALVPLTQNETILGIWKDHVVAQSADELNSWRVLWASLAARSSRALIDTTSTSDLATAMGTLADDPDTTGTQYTRLTCTTSNAKFLTKGVRAGDTLRYLYSVDGFGVSTWIEFTVASVVNEDVLILSSGNATAVSIAQKFEIWRNLTRTEAAADLLTRKAALAHSRVRLVWPDLVQDSGSDVPGYHLAATLAGLSSGIAPHQGLRHMGVTGFTGYQGSMAFNNAQFNDLRDGGYVVVDVDPDGLAYVRSAKTTDQTSIQTGDEAAVRVLDGIRLVLAGRMARYVGRTNMAESALTRLRAELESTLQSLRTATFIEGLGHMVIDYVVGRVRQHTTLLNVAVAPIALSHPYALDQVQFTLVVNTPTA